MQTIEVHGKRWQDSYGNTYHTATIYIDNDVEPAYCSPITYGYGDHYYHSTAIEWLVTQGYLTSDRPIREARELGVSYEAVDVKSRHQL